MVSRISCSLRCILSHAQDSSWQGSKTHRHSDQGHSCLSTQCLICEFFRVFFFVVHDGYFAMYTLNTHTAPLCHASKPQHRTSWSSIAIVKYVCLCIFHISIRDSCNIFPLYRILNRVYLLGYIFLTINVSSNIYFHQLALKYLLLDFWRDEGEETRTRRKR